MSAGTWLSTARRGLEMIAAATALSAAVACHSGDLRIVATGDGEGTVRGCPSCTTPGGLGDIARRATAIRQQRHSGEGALVLDAGNAFFGPETAGDEAVSLVSAYNAIGYDAVNVSFRDFRLGKRRTLAVLGKAAFPLLSANLVDEQSGRPLFRPFMVTRAGGSKVAVVGTTEIPAGVMDLPHVRAQLKGVKVRAVLDALAEWLPRAHSGSRRIVLLFYGSATGLASIRARYGSQLVLIVVGGLAPGTSLPSDFPPTFKVSEHGRQLTRVTLGDDGSTHLADIDVDSQFAPAHDIRRLFEAGAGAR